MTGDSEHKDRLYDEPRGEVTAFAFDAAVAAVFPDMINRSVPGYAAVVAMTGLLAGRHAQAGSRAYDLGCSLGATTFAMAGHIEADDCTIVAVDNAPAMIDRLNENIGKLSQPGPAIETVCADIRDTDIADASVVVLNYTLQFVPKEERLGLLKKIHAGMRPGGCLILSEKLAFEDAEEAKLHTQLHEDFKRAQGYSELEIAQKRAALENVLVPETREAHLDRLREAGFVRATLWFQCLNFASFIAFRD